MGFTDLGFNILAKDKGASSAFAKVARSVDNTTSAMAKAEKATEAAAAASVKLQRAQSAEADSIGKVRVAEQKLDEVRKNSKAKASQIAAAEEALAAAKRKSADASDAARAAAKRSTDSQSAAAAAAKRLADAQAQAFDKIQGKAKETAAKVGKSGEDAGGKFSAGFSKSIPALGGRISGFFKTGLGVAGGAALTAGAVAAGGFISGFKGALEQGTSNAKFQGQLGLTNAEAAKAGKIAGDLYTANYGESIAGVNDAIRSVIQNTNVTLNSVDLKPVTAKVLDLTTTFDQDLGGVTRAVGQLMRTGLVKNAGEALDVITRGFQSGADKADDFLDTLNEYPTQLRKLGLDGKTATGLLSQGLKAGARDSDIVADALKEFSIRAVDGSTATAAGFKSLGLSAKTMTDQIARGGKPAAAGLQTVLDKLRGIKDPVKQSQIAVELFGTQAEDLGAALFALDPKHAVDALGQVAGAAGKLDQTIGTTPQATVNSFFRTIKQGAVNSMGGVIGAFIEGSTEAKGFQGVIERAAIGTRIGFDKFSELGSRLFADAKGWAKSLIDGLKNGVDTGDWKPLGKSLGDGVVKGLKSIGETSGKLLDAIGALLDKVDWGKLGSKISGGISRMLNAVDWKKLGDALGDSVISLVQKSTTLSEKFGRAFKDLMDKVDWQKVGHDSTTSIGKFISGIDWGQLAKTLGIMALKSLKFDKTVHDALVGSASDLVIGIGDAIITEIEKQRLKLVGWTKRVGGDLISGLWSGIRGAMNGVGGFLKATIVDPIVDWMKSLFGVHSPSTVFAGIGRELIAGLKGGIAATARGIGTWIYRTVIAPVVAPFARAGSWLVQHGRNFIQGLFNGVVGYLRAIKGVGNWLYANVVSPAVRAFAKAGTWLSRAGSDLVDGLTGGISSRMKSIGTWLKSNVVDPVVSAVKRFFGIKSPSTVFAGIGGHLVSGLMKGLSTTSGAAIAKKVFGDMPSALRSIVGKGLISVSNLPRKAMDALGSAIGIGQPLGGPAGKNQSNVGIVRTLAAQYGWGSGAQWNALQSLIMGESGFNSNAQNPTSSAYGLFQFLDSTWGSVGASKTSDPWQQTIAGLKYIAGSYGSPANAYSKWSSRSPHWYKQGTPWVPDDQLAYLHKGEAVVPADVNRQRLQGGGGSQPITINLRGANGLDRVFGSWLVQLVRTNPALAAQLKVLLS